MPRFIELVSVIFESSLQVIKAIFQLLLLIAKFPFEQIIAEARESPIPFATSVAVLSYTATFLFFFSSTFFASLHQNQTWIPILFAFLCLVPFFLSKPQFHINQIFLVIIKSLGSYLCFFFFNLLGSLLRVENDWNLMNFSACLVIFLLSLDFLFDVDELVQVSDGFLFSGLDLMLAQTVIDKRIVCIVGFLFCFLKESLKVWKQNLKNPLAEKEAKQKELENPLAEKEIKLGHVEKVNDVNSSITSPFSHILAEARVSPVRVARFLAVLSFTATFILFFSSTFFSSLTKYQKWIPIVFALMCLIPLFIPKPQKFYVNQIFLAFLKSLGSFFCFFSFNLLGSILKIENDWCLINSSAWFVIFLFSIDHVFDLEDFIQLSDGYLYAGLGLMLGQKLIPKLIVCTVGFLFCLVKEFAKLWKKMTKENPRTETEDKLGDTKKVNDTIIDMLGPSFVEGRLPYAN